MTTCIVIGLLMVALAIPTLLASLFVHNVGNDDFRWLYNLLARLGVVMSAVGTFLAVFGGLTL